MVRLQRLITRSGTHVPGVPSEHPSFMAKSHFSSYTQPGAMNSLACLLLSKQPKNSGFMWTPSDLRPPLYPQRQAVQNKKWHNSPSQEIEMVFKTVCLSAHILNIAPKESSHLLYSVCSIRKTHRFRSHYL